MKFHNFSLIATLMTISCLTGNILIGGPELNPVKEFGFWKKEIKPLLENNCWKCHGSREKIKAELRLTTREGILEGGELGAASNQWVGSLIWYSTILVLIGGIFFVVDLAKGLIKS